MLHVFWRGATMSGPPVTSWCIDPMNTLANNTINLVTMHPMFHWLRHQKSAFFYKLSASISSISYIIIPYSNPPSFSVSSAFLWVKSCPEIHPFPGRASRLATLSTGDPASLRDPSAGLIFIDMGVIWIYIYIYVCMYLYIYLSIYINTWINMDFELKYGL